MGMTDNDRIECLEKLNKQPGYTGYCTLLLCETGRGWRLHETGKGDGEPTVRKAIDKFISEKDVNQKCQTCLF